MDHGQGVQHSPVTPTRLAEVLHTCIGRRALEVDRDGSLTAVESRRIEAEAEALLPGCSIKVQKNDFARLRQLVVIFSQKRVEFTLVLGG